MRGARLEVSRPANSSEKPDSSFLTIRDAPLADLLVYETEPVDMPQVLFRLRRIHGDKRSTRRWWRGSFYVETGSRSPACSVQAAMMGRIG